MKLIYFLILFTFIGQVLFSQVAEEIITEVSCPGAPEIINFFLTNAHCGINDGTMTLVASGGSGAYEYVIQVGQGFISQTTAIFTGLAPGIYKTFVSNVDQDCYRVGPEIEILGSILSISQKTSINPSCEKSNGRIELSGNGGITGYYEFGLQNTLSESGPKWNSSGVYGSLFAGTYRTFIRNASDKSCATEGLTITLTNSSIQPHLSIVSTNHTSCGNTDGQIMVSGTGGSGSYLFRLNDGVWQSTGTFTGLSEGYYIPEIKNNVTGNGACIESGDVIGIEGSELITVTVEEFQHTSCGQENGLMILRGHGSSGTYEYRLNNGAWTTSGLFLNISSGVYTPYVRSSSDLTCIIAATPVTIQASVGITVAVNSKSNPTTCSLSNGSITLNAPFPNGSFEYRLNQGNWQTSPTFNGLVSGNYVPWIRNIGGESCETKGSTIVLASGADIQFTPSKTDVTCFAGTNGSINLNITSGSAPFNFNWSGPITIGNVSNSTGLRVGTYNVTVTDANNCSTSQSISLTQPDPITLNLITKPAATSSSNDGQIDLKIEGGTPVYSMLWSIGVLNQSLLTNLVGNQVYSVTVTDAQNCQEIGSVQVPTICSTEDCESTAVTILKKRICSGQTYNFYGQVLTQSGIYLHEYISNTGGHIIIQLELVVFDDQPNHIEATILSCDSYPIGDQSFSTAGTHIVHLAREGACDSVVILNLSVFHVQSEAPDGCSATIRLQPDGATGKDAMIVFAAYTTPSQNPQATNYANSDLRSSQTWTPYPYVTCTNCGSGCGCYTSTHQSLIDFPQIREGISEVGSAYHLITAKLQINSSFSTGHTLRLVPIISDWQENTVTWNTAPMIDASSYIDFTVQAHTGSNQLNEIDITEIIRKMMKDKNIYGVKIFQISTTPEKHTFFINSENTNPALRPSLILEFGKNRVTNITQSICDGQIVEIGTETYSVPGTYEQILQASNDCDSILKINIYQNEVENSQVKICEGQTFQVGDISYTEPGHYQIPVLNGNYCEKTISLEIADTHHVYVEAVIPYNGNYSIGDQTFNETGRYVHTIMTKKGCDSLVTLDLIKLPYQDPSGCLKTVSVRPASSSAGKDAHISSLYPNNNFGTSTSISLYNYTTAVQDGLLDFPTIRQIDSLRNRYVASATLTLFITGRSGSNLKLQLHKITEDWIENTVNYSNRPDYDPGYVEAVAGSSNTFVTIDVTEYVRAMQKDECYGFLMKCTPNTLSFRSSDASVGYYLSQFPKLTIVYDNSVTSGADLVNTALCFDGQVKVNGQNYTAPGTYFQTTNLNGCDISLPVVVREGNPKSDYDKLVELFFATNGSSWSNNTGWLTDCHVCEWYGINCDKDRKIRKIDVKNNNLTGYLPGGIFEISTIQQIDLSNNQIGGELPEEVTFDGDLISIIIDHNEIEGEIPDRFQELCGRNIFVSTQGNNLNCTFEDFCQGTCNQCFTIGKECFESDCYVWEKDGEVIEGAITAELEVCTDQPGLYHLLAFKNGELICEDITKIGMDCDLQVSILSDKKAFCVNGESIRLEPNGEFAQYSWTAGPGVVWPIGARSTRETSVKQEGTYYLTVKDEDYCFAAAAIHLGKGDPVSLQIFDFDPTVCPGQDFEITAITNGDLIEWKDQNKNVIGIGNAISGIDIPNTTSSLFITVSNALCVTTSGELPFNVPSLVLSSSEEGLCPGETAILSALGTGVSQYGWSLNGQTFSTNPTVTVNQPGIYVISVVNGSGTCTFNDQIVVEAYSEPDLSLIAYQTTICSGETITISATGADTYSWNAGTTQADGSVIKDTPASNTTYTVTGISSDGCQGTASIAIAVDPSPTIGAGPDQSVCEGASAIFTASGTDISQYEWTYAGQVIGNTASITVQEDGMYTVKGINNVGTCFATDQVQLMVNQSPEITLGIASTTICDGERVTILATGADTYTWNPPFGPGSLLEDYPGVTTTYTATGSLANGCQGAASVTVTVNPAPVVDAGPDHEICVGEEVMLNGSGDATTYEWLKKSDGSLISSGSQLTVAPSENIDLILRGTTDNCVRTDELSITVNELTDPFLISSYLDGLGFYKLPIVVGGQITTPQTFEFVLDYANLEVNLTTADMDLAPLLEQFLNRDYFGSGESIQGIITKNEYFCGTQNTLDDVKSEVEAHEWGYWLHIFKDPASNQDYLYVGVKNPDRISLMGPLDAEHRQYIDDDLDLVSFDVYENPYPSIDELLFDFLLFDISDQLVTYSLPEEQTPARNSAAVGCIELAANSAMISPAGISLMIPAGSLVCSNPKYSGIYFNGGLGAIFTEGPSNKRIPYKGVHKGNTFLGYAIPCENNGVSDNFYSVDLFGLPVQPINVFLPNNLIYLRTLLELVEIEYKATATNGNGSGPAMISELNLLQDCIKVEACGNQYQGPCFDLLIDFKYHEYLLEDGPFKNAICANPCILSGLYHEEFGIQLSSVWIEQMKNVFAGMLLIAVPPIIATTLEAAIGNLALAEVVPRIVAWVQANSVEAAMAYHFDCLLQSAVYYYWPENNIPITWEEARKKIDHIQASFSALEALVDLRNKYAEVAVSAGLSCIVDGAFEQGQIKESFDVQECAIGALSAALFESLFRAGGAAITHFVQKVPPTQFIDGFEALFGTQVETFAQAGLTFDGTRVYGRFKNVYGDVLTDDHVKALFKLADNVPASLLTDVRIQLDNNPELKARLLESDFFLKFRKLENTIPDLTDLEKSDLLKDLVDNPDQFLDYMEDLAGKKVRAWNILNRAGRSQLRSDPVFLAKVFKCVDHSELISLGIDDQYLVNIAASLSGDFSQAGSQVIIEDVETILTTSKAQLLEDEIFGVISSFGDFLSNNTPSTNGNLDEKVIEHLRGPLFSNRKGAVGILKFLQDPVADIQGKNLLFEIPVPNARGTTSRIDVTVNATRYEVKNCSECITSNTIREQFIERDLFNANTVNDITKWKIYEQGYTQGQLIDHLKANKGSINEILSGNDAQKATNFRNFFDLDVLDEVVIDSHIVDFVETYFNTIFK